MTKARRSSVEQVNHSRHQEWRKSFTGRKAYNLVWTRPPKAVVGALSKQNKSRESLPGQTEF